MPRPTKSKECVEVEGGVRIINGKRVGTFSRYVFSIERWDEVLAAMKAFPQQVSWNAIGQAYREPEKSVVDILSERRRLKSTTTTDTTTDENP